MASNDKQFSTWCYFIRTAFDRTTEITVKLRSSIEPAKLAQTTRDYLTNFKRVVEEASAP